MRYLTELECAGVFLLVFATTCAIHAKQRRPFESTPEAQIRRVLDQQVEAWNRRDLEGFMKGYWRSQNLSFYSAGEKTAGWETTLGRYRGRYQSEGREMGRLDFSEVRIEMLSPRAAFVRGRWHLKMSNSEPGGLFTLIFRRLPEGWKIVHDHTSAAAP